MNYVFSSPEGGNRVILNHMYYYLIRPMLPFKLCISVFEIFKSFHLWAISATAQVSGITFGQAQETMRVLKI